MSPYHSNIELAEAARLIRGAARVTVVTHAKPDGDAFGSVVAMTAALRGRGQQVTGWFVPPVAESLMSLRGGDGVRLFEDGSELDPVDLVLVLDTGAMSQLLPMREQLEPHLPRTLVIDHHLSGDLAAKWRYIDGEAAACCELIASLLDQMEIPIDDPIVSDALFVGIAADTGWFRFSNTRPQTHELAARLRRAGVDHAQLYAMLEQNERAEKLALMNRALNSLKLLAGGTVALMGLRAGDFKETGAALSDTEQFVDIPQIVGSVQPVAMITEPPHHHPPEPVRVSFRSKPGPSALNVAELANQFGGGGHARAAGARIDSPVDEVISRVAAAISSTQG